MSGDPVSSEWGRRIFRPVTDRRVVSLPLTAEEGFLLSRLDGYSPWRWVREIGGMPPEEADLCVEAWLAAELVEIVGLGPDQPTPPVLDRPPTARSTKPIPTTVDSALIVPDLDLSSAVQRRILEFECELGRPAHQLLGLAQGADAREIKRAYFKLSREFHPDRYFRKQLGDYGDRLDRIFKRIVEAYETLCVESAGDHPTRCALDAEEGSSRPEFIESGETTHKLEQLRQRMPVRMPAAILAERRAKASGLVREAERSARSGRLREAIISLQLAIRFDPSAAEIRKRLLDFEARFAIERADRLLGERSLVDGLGTSGELASLLAEFEKLLSRGDPDGSIPSYAARLALKLGDSSKAQQFAEMALAQDPHSAKSHTVMGWVHRERHEVGHAKRCFEQALVLDPSEMDARKALATLRVSRARFAQEVCNG